MLILYLKIKCGINQIWCCHNYLVIPTTRWFPDVSHELHIVILELNCWVIGDEPHSIFPVEVASSKTVRYMREAILPKMENSCSDLVAKSLVLWKVNCLIWCVNRDDFMFQQVDIDLTTDSDLLKSIKVEGDIPHGEELKPWVQLSKVFTDGLEDEHLHIIVKRPAGTCNQR